MLDANVHRVSRLVRLAMCLSLAGALLWTLVASQRAYASAELTTSNPAADAVLTTAPVDVTLTFSQGLDASGSRFTVTGADGTPVNMGDSQIVATDQTSLYVALMPSLPDGVYSVQWETLSAEDSATATGSFTFTVSATSTDTSVPGVPDTTTNDQTTTQPDTTQPDTTQPTTSQIPNTAGEPQHTPSLAMAACMLLVIAGIEFRRRSRIAAENATYAQDRAE